MDNLIFFVIGGLLVYLVMQRPLQITIHHKNENIIHELPESAMIKMADVINKIDPAEDKTYEEMGKVMDNVSEIFGGSDRP